MVMSRLTGIQLGLLLRVDVSLHCLRKVHDMYGSSFLLVLNQPFFEAARYIKLAGKMA